MSLIALNGNKKRATFSKYGKALDNFFMIFQPDNSKLLRTEPNPEVLQELEQNVVQFNLKVQKANELRGTPSFRAISREQGVSYHTKHEGANRSYNPKYEFIKTNAVNYTIPKSAKETSLKEKEKEQKNAKSAKFRPTTANARYFQTEAPKNVENNEIIEEKPEENYEGNPVMSSALRNNNKNNENIDDEEKKKLRAMSAKTAVSNASSRKFERKVFPCVDFHKQTERKPFNYVSSCVNEHNFDNFMMNHYTGKKILNFKKYLNRKTYLCDDAKFELPDKFYLNNFNWNKIYPQKSKCFLNFDRFREKNNKNLETKTFINSSVDVKDLPETYQHLAHFKRLPSPNFDKILGRNQAKILTERTANVSGFRPKSAYGKYSNANAGKLEGNIQNN